jgi:hypothetical protein
VPTSALVSHIFAGDSADGEIAGMVRDEQFVPQHAEVRNGWFAGFALACTAGLSAFAVGFWRGFCCHPAMMTTAPPTKLQPFVMRHGQVKFTFLLHMRQNSENPAND